MSERPQPTEGLLDAYLDGLLGDADRKAFELELDRRHDLRSAVEHQQAIDAALKRLVSPPSEEQLNLIAERADEAGRRRISPGRGWRVVARRLAVAAALAGGTFGAWQIWDFVRPGSHSANPYVQQPWRSFETVYRDKIADGFQPAWVCKDDKEFADSFWAIHRQRLLLGELPEGTKALGLAYSNSITPRTSYLLAQASGERLIVFVDRIERDTQQPAPAGLHLFRRQIGKLVLYELSPLDEAALLDRFYDPDADGDFINTDKIEEVGQ